MKPILFFTGNMASGKSTLGSEMAHKLGVPFISLDDSRGMYGNGKMSGEYLAWSHFFDNLEKSIVNGGVFECTGTGQHVRHIKFIIYHIRDELEREGQEMKVANIVVDCDSEVCLKRHRERNFPKVPFPYKMSPEKIIEFIDKEIQKDYYEYCLGIHTVLRVNNTDKNPKDTMKEIIRFLEEENIIQEKHESFRNQSLSATGEGDQYLSSAGA